MSFYSDISERLRRIFFRRRDEQDLHDELQFHVEMETEQKRRAGVPTGEARRQSLVALGGIERTKEDVRDAGGTRFAEDSAGDVAYTIRTLRRSPGFAIVAILTLAIGIGGTTAVYSAVDAALLQPLPYRDPGQLVRMYAGDTRAPGSESFLTPVHFVEYRRGLASFSALATTLTYDESGADIGTGDAVRRVRILPVSADYFDVLQVHPSIGQAFGRNDETGTSADDGPAGASVVVSHALWAGQLHSDAHAVGQPLQMNGRTFTVVGVMPDGFRDPISGSVDAWIPFNLTPGNDASNSTNHYLTVIGRLQPGVTVARAQAELALFGKAMAEKYPDAKNTTALLVPLKEDLVSTSSRTLEIMFGAVLLVLVLVCVNVANLLLVRGSERAREFALRTALGAGRGRLVRQLLIESLALAVVGDIAGLALARLALPAIAAMGASSLPSLATLHLEPHVLALSLLVSTICAVGFGLAPAVRAARTQPSDVLREQSRSTTGGGSQMRMREWLVVSQVALALVLLVGAGLLVASARRLGDINLGVDTSHALVFELHLPEARFDSLARGRFYDDFARRVEQLPGVASAGGISRLPATGSYHQWTTRATTGPLVGDEQRSVGGAENRVVSGEYFKTAGMRLIAGRLFNESDTPLAPRRVIVSASLAKRFYPGVNAVGQRLNTGGGEREIIGVVSDVALTPEGDEARYVYHWHAQFAGDRNWSLVQLVRTKGPVGALQPEIQRALLEMDPQLVMFKPTTLAGAIGRGEAQRTFALRIIGCFALVALALAALGLFGVLSYGVRLRTREFGIRMALGAEAGSIQRMVIRQGLLMTGIGTVVGLAGALALSRVMASLVFRISPLDPFVLGIAALFMLVVATIAAYLPARRATSVDPRSALQ